MSSFANKAIVLVSGGMDSLVTAAIASKNFNLAFLHLNYGQKTQKRELKAFSDICDHFSVSEKLIVDLNYFSQIGGSSLTDKGIEISDAKPEYKGIPSSYVPFRNANILSVAVSWAEIIGARKIFFGAVEEDSSGYPDCREVFYTAFNKAVKLGTKPETHIEIVTPVIHMKKHEIVLKGNELNVPFELSWSCYRNDDIACGECDSCALRLKGFQIAGIEDPLIYKKKPNYRVLSNK